MQPNASTEGDLTPEVEPTIKHTVSWRVTSVDVLPDARLRVTFVDGTSGEVYMEAFLRIGVSTAPYSSRYATEAFCLGSSCARRTSVAQRRRSRARRDV